MKITVENGYRARLAVEQIGLSAEAHVVPRRDVLLVAFYGKVAQLAEVTSVTLTKDGEEPVSYELQGPPEKGDAKGQARPMVRLTLAPTSAPDTPTEGG